jgi:hypothetical protein
MKTLILLLALAVTGAAQDPDATARFLAGESIDGTALATFSQVPAWRDHAQQIDSAWKQSEQRQLGKIRAWAPDNLGSIYSSPSPVFYFFSGPDILYAQALFPNAGTYVLCAKEPVGNVVNPAEVPPSELPLALAGMRKSLTSLLNWSFFITQDLRVDIKQRHFTGILPVLEILLAKSGARVTEVVAVSCDKGGGIAVGGGKGTPGVRLRFNRGGGQQTLFYFAADLSNGGLQAHDGVLRFCERLGKGQSLLKAASYLPHEAGFSRIREWLLANSRTIVQDPSGIPFREIDPNQWRIQLWGNQGKPIELFAKYQQPQLENALAAAARPELPFGFGYQHLPANAVMIVAERQRTSTTSAAPPPATVPAAAPQPIPVAVPVPAREPGGLRR